jgi:hypothetical protein
MQYDDMASYLVTITPEVLQSSAEALANARHLCIWIWAWRSLRHGSLPPQRQRHPIEIRAEARRATRVGQVGRAGWTRLPTCALVAWSCKAGWMHSCRPWRLGGSCQRRQPRRARCRSGCGCWLGRCRG